MDFITSFPSYFLSNLHAVNLLYAGIIAVFFGLATASTAGLVFVPAIAAVVYIAARAVIPPLINHAAIVTPNMDKVLAEQALSLYVGFFIAILIVFAIKKAAQAAFG
ncbi:MAG: hypothetical protein KGJ78_12415 [Alphaproteobacteria bacterium]|nr:hypothetical protein [Alphaproteobacteria bacterium]